MDPFFGVVNLDEEAQRARLRSADGTPKRRTSDPRDQQPSPPTASTATTTAIATESKPSSAPTSAPIAPARRLSSTSGAGLARDRLMRAVSSDVTKSRARGGMGGQARFKLGSQTNNAKMASTRSLPDAAKSPPVVARRSTDRAMSSPDSTASKKSQRLGRFEVTEEGCASPSTSADGRKMLATDGKQDGPTAGVPHTDRCGSPEPSSTTATADAASTPVKPRRDSDASNTASGPSSLAATPVRPITHISGRFEVTDLGPETPLGARDSSSDSVQADSTAGQLDVSGMGLSPSRPRVPRRTVIAAPAGAPLTGVIPAGPSGRSSPVGQLTKLLNEMDPLKLMNALSRKVSLLMSENKRLSDRVLELESENKQLVRSNKKLWKCHDELEEKLTGQQRTQKGGGTTTLSLSGTVSPTSDAYSAPNSARVDTEAFKASQLKPRTPRPVRAQLPNTTGLARPQPRPAETPTLALPVKAQSPPDIGT